MSSFLRTPNNQGAGIPFDGTHCHLLVSHRLLSNLSAAHSSLGRACIPPPPPPSEATLAGAWEEAGGIVCANCIVRPKVLVFACLIWGLYLTRLLADSRRISHCCPRCCVRHPCSSVPTCHPPHSPSVTTSTQQFQRTEMRATAQGEAS